MPKKNAIDLDVTKNADGFTASGGTTPRSISVTGGDVAMAGSGGSAVFTLPSTSQTAATLNWEVNKPLVMKIAALNDNEFNGIVVAGTAGDTMIFGDLCYLDTSVPEWKLVDANDATAGTRMLGVCVTVGGVADNGAGTFLIFGTVRADAAFPTFGAGQVYISETAGDVVTSANVPTTTDAVIRVVGHAYDGNTMFFHPDNVYYTHT